MHLSYENIRGLYYLTDDQMSVLIKFQPCADDSQADTEIDRYYAKYPKYNVTNGLLVG